MAIFTPLYYCANPLQISQLSYVGVQQLLAEKCNCTNTNCKVPMQATDSLPSEVAYTFPLPPACSV